MPAGAYTDTVIECSLAPSVGSGYAIHIRNMWIPLPSANGFAVPTIASLSPATGVAAGGPIDIMGAHFGARACNVSTVTGVTMTLMPLEPSPVFDPVSMSFTSVHTYTVLLPSTLWSPSRISCSSPALQHMEVPVSMQVLLATCVTGLT